MAKEKKEKTPGYEEFHDALQSGAVRNVYIFHGKETYLMQQAVAELQALLVPLPSRLPCPATFWMSRSRPVHP